MSGRTFLWRWNRRVVRQEWRQYAVIFALICIASTLSTVAMLFVNNVSEPPGAEGYGGGNLVAGFVGDPSSFEQAMIDQGHPFGTIMSTKLIVPGATNAISIKAADPNNAIVEPLFVLLDGRWPTAGNEIAVTDQLPLAGATIGQTIELNGQTVEVVGLLENPTDLGEEFILAPDLDALSIAEPDKFAEVLVAGSRQDIIFPVGADISSRDREELLSERTAATIAVSVVSAVALLEVALLVSAGFAVIARRRSRQYGLLAAAGATPRQIRTSAGITGNLLGLTAGLLGVALGIGFGLLAVKAVETTVSHRIDYAVPLWAVIPNFVFTVFVAGMAARWPARAMSKQPVVALLASLRARPEPVGRSVVVGVVLTAIGAVAMAIGFTRLNAPAAIAGVLLGPIGLLLMAPLLVQQIGKLATRLPLPARMGGRATARYNRRSAAMVAALGLALGIPIALATTTTSLEQHERAKPPNLQPNMSALWLPGADDAFVVVPAEYVGVEPTAEVEQLVADVAAELPDSRIAPIEVVVSNWERPRREDVGRLGVTEVYGTVNGMRRGTEAECGNDCSITGLGEVDADGESIIYLNHPAWLASPELVEVLDPDGSLNLDGALADPATIAVAGDGMILWVGYEAETNTEYTLSDGIETQTIEGLPLLDASQAAQTLLSPDWVNAQPGFRTATVGWVMVSPEPIPTGTRIKIEGIVGSTLVPEYHAPVDLVSIRDRALLIGIIAGLGIIAAAVNLLNGERADENRILHSIGAPKATTRKTAAAIAGFLALAGTLIGVAIGYIALVPQLVHPTAHYPVVVPLTVVGALIIFPLLAAGIGWLTNRTDHQNLARPL